MDVSELAQEKRGLVVVLLLSVAAVLSAALLFIVGDGGKGIAGQAISPASAQGAPMGGPAGMPATGGVGSPGGAAAAPSVPSAGSIGKGRPVEPFRSDPFVASRRPALPAPADVLPPLVAVIEAPVPPMVPMSSTVIPPDAAGSDSRSASALQAETRRLSGVLWNGKVVAILESSDPTQARKAWIVKPGDQLPDQTPGRNLIVKSISREQMVLVPMDRAGAREIVIDLKPSLTAPAPGMGPGGPSVGPGGPGTPPGMPAGAEAAPDGPPPGWVPGN